MKGEERMKKEESREEGERDKERGSTFNEVVRKGQSHMGQRGKKLKLLDLFTFCEENKEVT